jgi:hypothetical protein
MTAYASRLPFSLDPLIGEAKQRMRRRRLLLLVLAILIGGAGTAAGLVLSQTHASNPWAIRRGMTVQQVRNVAGSAYSTVRIRLGEYARIRARDLTGRLVQSEQCWQYRAIKANTNIDGVGACFTRGRVLDVVVSTHG